VVDKFGIQTLVRFSFKFGAISFWTWPPWSVSGSGEPARTTSRRGMPRRPRRRTAGRARQSGHVTAGPRLGSVSQGF
jgi:hypothetical protein